MPANSTLAGLDLLRPCVSVPAACGLGRRRDRRQVRLRAVAEVDRIDLLARVDRLVLGARRPSRIASAPLLKARKIEWSTST